MTLSPSHSITIGGKELKITPPTLQTEDFFTDYLKRFAAQEVSRLRESYGPSFPDAMRAVTSEVAAGSYDWLGDLFWKAITTDRHMQHLAMLTLNQEAGGAVTVDFLRKHWRDVDGTDVFEKDGQLVQISKGQMLFNKIVEYIARPNSQGPA